MKVGLGESPSSSQPAGYRGDIVRLSETGQRAQQWLHRHLKNHKLKHPRHPNSKHGDGQPVESKGGKGNHRGARLNPDPQKKEDILIPDLCPSETNLSYTTSS